MKGKMLLLCGCYETVAGGSQKQHISSSLLCCRDSDPQALFFSFLEPPTTSQPKTSPHKCFPSHTIWQIIAFKAFHITTTLYITRLGEPSENQSAMRNHNFNFFLFWFCFAFFVLFCCSHFYFSTVWCRFNSHLSRIYLSHSVLRKS